MKSSEILNKYIEFYKDRKHVEIPNISLVPENDPSLLFVNSGMFPLVPYLTGKAKHPSGKRVVNVQRCLRFEDLDNIGNTLRHTTAFHMIGNWSFGDYFKKEQLPWIYEFLIEELGLDPNRLFPTVFKGDDSAPKDTEAIEILQKIFKKYNVIANENERIFSYDKKENWWQRGDAIGELGGPDSEIYYYLGEAPIPLGLSPAENDDLFLEIGNSVFLQYELTEKGWEEISQKNVDFGGGLERLALVQQNKTDIYETDVFWPIIEKIQELSKKDYNDSKETKKHMRKVADHMRSASLMAMDGIYPSNKEQGYILRKFLRLMIRSGYKLGIENDISVLLYSKVIETLGWLYPQLTDKKQEIVELFSEEEKKFGKVLIKGAREANKKLEVFIQNKINQETTPLDVNDLKGLAQIGFDLEQSQGYPFDMFTEDLKDKNFELSNQENDFLEHYEYLTEQHQQNSREGAKQRFTGGLADQEEQTVKFHTATHLLHWALREVLGKHVQQMGSNITGERLRFDFSHSKKLTENELKEIQHKMNEKVTEAIPVRFVTLSFEEAEKTGALHFFKEKYGDNVNVYYIGNSIDNSFSKEFCGGPHVKNTKDIGKIEIFKQKKIGDNLIRIYARANK